MTLDPKFLEKLVEENLRRFYAQRLGKIRDLQLRTVFCRKNPYLFRAIGIQNASEIVEQILIATISSSDETLFGNEFFEPIAKAVSGGKVSDAEGVDFTVETETRYFAYSMKSGPNALNASAQRKQAEQFNSLRHRLLKLHKAFDPVLAAGYGRINKPPEGNRIYRTISGQKFWTEITGDPSFHVRLITLMKNIPEEHRNEYQPEWDAALNRLTREFTEMFCNDTGHIDWERYADFVSAIDLPAEMKAKRAGKVKS